MSWSQRIISWSYYLLFILVPLIFLTSTSELFEFNKMIVTYFLTIVIVSAWFIRMLSVKRIIFHRTLLDIPIILFLISQFVSLIFSIDPRVSWLGYYGRFNGGLISLICYALLYWAFVSNMTKKSVLSAIKSALITSALIAVWGILERLGFSFSCLFTTGKFNDSCWVQDVQTRVFASLGQPNWLASYLVALIFIPISNFLSVTTHKIKYLSVLLAALLFLTLIFTNSRSGMLAFGVSSVLFWAIYLWKSRNWKSFIILNSLFIIPILIFPNVTRELIFKTSSLSSQNTTPTTQVGPALETGGTESSAIRQIVWTGALRSWSSSPKNILLGSGPETFAMTYYQYRPIEHNNTSEWELLYNKAHNEFLNFLATTGIFGLGSYLILLISMALISRPSLKNLAFFAGWLSLSVMNFWGFSVVITQLLLFLLPAIAIVLGSPEDSQNKPTQLPGSVARYVLICLVFLAGFLTSIIVFRYWLADTYFAKASKFEHQFSLTQDVQDILTAYLAGNQAYELEPSEPVINSELGTLAAYMSLLTSDTDATASANFTQKAIAANERAVTISPFHPNYYKSFSRTLILLSTRNEAFLPQADEILAKAQLISPTDPRIPFNRGIIAKYQKKYLAAQTFFNVAVKLKPDFSDALGQLQQLASQSAMLK